MRTENPCNGRAHGCDHAQIFCAHGLFHALRKSRVLGVRMAMCTNKPTIGKDASGVGEDFLHWSLSPWLLSPRLWDCGRNMTVTLGHIPPGEIVKVVNSLKSHYHNQCHRHHIHYDHHHYHDHHYLTLPRCRILGVNWRTLSVTFPSTELLSWLPSGDGHIQWSY